MQVGRDEGVTGLPDTTARSDTRRTENERMVDFAILRVCRNF